MAAENEIWVNVTEGAEKTGYHLDHVRRLARENWHLPEAERSIRVRKNGLAYELWLPDVIHYIETYGDGPPLKPNLDPKSVKRMWVNVTEGAEITGYSRDHMIKLAMLMWKKPEKEREIRLNKRSSGYDIWLPDLVAYTINIGHGPKRKRKPLDNNHDNS